MELAIVISALGTLWLSFAYPKQMLALFDVLTFVVSGAVSLGCMYWAFNAHFLPQALVAWAAITIAVMILTSFSYLSSNRAVRNIVSLSATMLFVSALLIIQTN